MKQFISEFQDKLAVQSTFLVKEKNKQVGKNGKSYLSIKLSDKTGEIDARIWDNIDEFDGRFNVDDFVQVKGAVQSFQGRQQLVVATIDTLNAFDVKIQDFLPAAERPAEEMFAELLDILGGIKNTFIKQIVQNTLSDSSIKPLFMVAPAAKSIHHAYISGLLEHTLSICGVMKFLGGHYKGIDTDLLLFGAVYHDIGKIWELSFETSLGYTDVGRLVGHIPMGAELVEKKASEIPNFPFELKNKLKHIVLSHHGKIEYGSPKLPSFLEAVVVGMIDDLDSKVNQIQKYVESERRMAPEGTKWSRFNKDFQRYFMLD
jgi:3'-5' exoribonuclease